MIFIHFHDFLLGFPVVFLCFWFRLKQLQIREDSKQGESSFV